MHIAASLKDLLRGPSTNYSLGHSPNLYTLLSANSRVLDLGSKEKHGSYYPGSNQHRVYSLDLAHHPRLSVVADAHALPFLNNSFDAVICISVLMYTERPITVMAEIFRVLKPGGLVHVNVPFVYRYAHDTPDLYRFSVDGIRVLGEQFDQVQSGFNRGPASTMSDLLAYFLALALSFNSRRLFGITWEATKWVTFWIKYLDCFIAHHPYASHLCSGVFFVGRKPI